MKKYIFNNYTSEYKDFFQIEKEKLQKTLTPNERIEHVGSTAVPGLGGKGILDIVIGTKKEDFEKVKKQLEQVGYEFREKASLPERLFFRIDYNHQETKRRVHLHLTEFNSEEWSRVVLFRDYLLKNPKAVQEYIKIKKEAVEAAQGDGEKYRKYKEEFINEIVEKAKKLD